MATMATVTAKKSKLFTLVITALYSQLSYAGDWEFSPSIILDETYTDNVELTRANKIDSLVTQASIGLDTIYTSQYLRFNLTSNSTYALYSHDHDLDNDFHSLQSSLYLRVGDRGLSLFANASITNEPRNSATNALADLVTGDIVQREVYSTGITYSLANSDFLLNSTFSVNQTESQDNIGVQEGYNASIVSENGSSAKTIFWDINANYIERENNDRSSRQHQATIKLGFITSFKLNPFLRFYDEDNAGSISTGNSNQSNAYGIGIRWQVNPRFHLDVSYNKPTDESEDIDDVEEDNFFDVSIEWQPTIRTQLSANYTERFFGESYGLNLVHQNKRLTNSISYKEELQSFTRNNYDPIALGSFWCPDGNAENLTNCYVSGSDDISFENFTLINLTDFELIEDDVFSLNKSLAWNSSLVLARTTFTFNAQATSRENLETHIEDENGKASFAINRKLNSQTNLNLVASYTENRYQIETTNERKDRYRKVSIGYSKSLNDKLNFTFDLAHINRDSDVAQYNYQEGRATFKITKDF